MRPMSYSLQPACRTATATLALAAAALHLGAGPARGQPAGGALASSAVPHPAVAALAQDRRLRLAPEKRDFIAAQVLAMDAAGLQRLFCTDNGVDWSFPCPACGGSLEFSFAHPDALVCQGCAAVVDEANYPPAAAIEGSGPLGDPVVLAYSGTGNDRRFVGPLIRSRRHASLAEAARALGERYLETGDESCAARAIDILVGLAAVFPRWPVMEVRSFPRPARFFINPPRPYDHWVHYKWRHTHNYDVPEDLTFAYDFVYNSPAWERYPGGRARVEADLLRAGCEQAWTTHEDMGQAVNNLTGTLLASTILLGRVLGDPEMVRRAVATLKDMLRVFYHFDGMEYEGTLTYHGTVTGRCGIAERMLAGYSDPPWYTPPDGMPRFTAMDLKQEVPIYRRAWEVWGMMRFPNGNPICIHDTNFPAGRRAMDPGAEAANIELNAYGHFALGRGTGLEALQAHLHFCPFSWHSHYHGDKLGIILFGAGEELLSDIGYVTVGRKNRYFTTSSISHNTVTVEYAGPRPSETLAKADPDVVGTIARPKAAAAANRPVQDARSTLLAYDPGGRSGKLVQVVAASVPDAPHMGLELRTRELLLIALSPERSCLVDVFRIQGGSRHHFVLRPSSDEDVTTERCSAALGPERPGTLAGEAYAYGEVPPEPERRIPYAWLVHRLRPAAAAEDWSLTWLGSDSGARLNLFAAGTPEAELLLGQSPSMRRAQNNDRHADAYQNPHLILHRAERGSGNTFAAVYEAVPKDAQALVREVRFDIADDATALAGVSIRVVTEDATITVQAMCQAEPGAAGIRPTYRVTRRRGETVEWTWTQGSETHRFPLQRVLRLEEGDSHNGFIIAGSIPTGSITPGDWMRVRFGAGQAYGYAVQDVIHRDGETLIAITGEPGFAYAERLSRMLFYPFYETPGEAWIEAVPARLAVSEP